MLTAIAACSLALVKVGARTISSLDDGTEEAEVSAAIYGPTRDALLSSYPWVFATKLAGLARLVTAPDADWQSAYQLPVDVLVLRSVGRSGHSDNIPFEVRQTQLLTDSDEALVQYTFRPAEAATPPYFDDALVARLAAELVIPLTDSTTRFDMLFRVAEAKQRAAQRADREQVVRQPGNFSLVSVR